LSGQRNEVVKFVVLWLLEFPERGGLYVQKCDRLVMANAMKCKTKNETIGPSIQPYKTPEPGSAPDQCLLRKFGS
jgi:hypothetical protein